MKYVVTGTYFDLLLTPHFLHWIPPVSFSRTATFWSRDLLACHLINTLHDRRMTSKAIFLCLFFLSWVSVAKPVPSEINKVELLKAYLKIDTSNPPGNEMRAVKFWAGIFKKYEIPFTIFTMGDGHGNIVAKITGSGKKRPMVLLNHLDVVPVERANWHFPPFGAKEVDGKIYGRGAIDMKATAVSQAVILIEAKQKQWKLDRDIIFLGTADEETSGSHSGARWMVDKHFDSLNNPEFLMTEGSTISVENGKTVSWNIATTEKLRIELLVTAKGTAGHPVDYNPDQAIPKLVKALGSIQSFEPPIKVIPTVDILFKQLASSVPENDKKNFLDVKTALKDSDFRKQMLKDSALAPLLRTSITVTKMSAGSKSNVVPSEASAVLDVRLLPGEEPEELVQKLKTLVADKDVEFYYETAKHGVESSIDTELFHNIEKARDNFDAGVPLFTPPLTSSTDAPYFRAKGITVYGFEPYHLTTEDDRAHGNDEFISRDNLELGFEILRFIVFETCASKAQKPS